MPLELHKPKYLKEPNQAAILAFMHSKWKYLLPRLQFPWWLVHLMVHDLKRKMSFSPFSSCSVCSLFPPFFLLGIFLLSIVWSCLFSDSHTSHYQPSSESILTRMTESYDFFDNKIPQKKQTSTWTSKRQTRKMHTRRVGGRWVWRKL